MPWKKFELSYIYHSNQLCLAEGVVQTSSDEKLKAHSQVCDWQFLATESPLKIMKNAFYFTSKALSVLKIFKFSSWLFGYVSKWLDEKNIVNFKFYDVTDWLTNNCNTDIVQYLEK